MATEGEPGEIEDMRYADPDLCPDCRSALPRGVATCPTCALPVRHPLAVDLFTTLTRADALVAQLRSLASSPLPSPASTPSPTTPTTPTTPPTPTTPRPATPPPAPGRGVVGLAAVPRILLGLGAFCLLVAAIIFLAVSWSRLGVGGRTLVLLTMTATAVGGSLLLSRIGLRVAGESMSVVALGMMLLDVIGAHSAGWFGGSSAGWAVAAGGAAMALGGTGMALPRFGSGPRLRAPQVFVGLGYVVGWGGLLAAADHDLLTGHLLVLLGAGITWLSRTALPVRAWSVGLATVLVWSVTALLGVGSALSDPDLGALWADGWFDSPGWSLLASAATVLAPGLSLRRRDLLLGGASLGAVLVTVALVAPVVDESARVAGVVTLLVTVAWTAAYRLLPEPLRVMAITPAVIGSVASLFFAAATAVVALVRIAELGTGRPFDVVLRGPDPVTDPLLAVPSVLVPLLLAALLGTRGGRRIGAGWRATAAVVGGVAAVVTLASYDVPLALVIACLGLVAVVALGLGLTGSGGRATGLGLVALGLGGTGVLLALPSAPVAALASGIVLAVAAVAHLLGGTPGLRGAAGVGLAPAVASLVWSAGTAVDADPAWLGVPLLALLGVLVVARPRLDVELPAALVAVVAGAPAVLAAVDPGGSLALHLVGAGVVLSASALLHASRRALGWAAVPVFVLADWVWFADDRVTDPEPYTLPVAATLVVLGLLRLRRDPDAGTELALLPGLFAGTLPSLVWVLDDPLSLRAVVLGVACLCLTMLGAALRWSAPLLVGSVVGAVVVLREMGPYAADVPQWVWIGLAGALLTTVGITWERRLLEVRQAVGMLGRLR